MGAERGRDEDDGPERDDSTGRTAPSDGRDSAESGGAGERGDSSEFSADERGDTDDRGGPSGRTHGDPSGRDDSASGREQAARSEPPDSEESPNSEKPNSRVHVRRLDVLDTLRWSWEVLNDRRELFGLALVVNLLSVVATLGVSQSSPSADPEFADWVLWVYLAQYLAALVVGGVIYLTTADAVANHSRPLTDRLVAATKRLPALLGAAVVMTILVSLSLIPTLVVLLMDWANVNLGILLTLALSLVSVYVFTRLLLAYPACVIDGEGPIAGMRAGWLAATGIVRKVFAVGVVYVLTVVASNVVSGLFGTQFDVEYTLVSAAIGTVVLPILGLALAHLYLEGSRNR
jgi:hypothetical protein